MIDQENNVGEFAYIYLLYIRSAAITLAPTSAWRGVETLKYPVKPVSNARVHVPVSLHQT
jgi:hypothetical protein